MGGGNYVHELHDYSYKKTVIKVILIILISCNVLGLFGSVFLLFTYEFFSLVRLLKDIFIFFFNIANLFINWKLYETTSCQKHEEARKWLKMQIAIFVLYIVVRYFIFSLLIGFAAVAIFGIFFSCLIYGLWFFYVDNFIKLECFLEEKSVPIPVW